MILLACPNFSCAVSGTWKLKFFFAVLYLFEHLTEETYEPVLYLPVLYQGEHYFLEWD